MSSKINYNNNTFNVDLRLFIDKTPIDSPDKIIEYIPIAPGSVQKFIIDDTLACPGITGAISFNNRFNLLSELVNKGNFESGKNVIGFVFNIVDENIDASVDGSTLAGATVLIESRDIVMRIEDQMLAFSFEDIAVDKMKITRALNEENNIQAVASSTNTADAIGELFKQTNRITNFEISQTPPSPSPLLGNITLRDSYYDIYERLNKTLYYNNDGPGIVKIDLGRNQLNLSSTLNVFSIGEKTKKLITSVSNKKRDLKEFVSETFTIANNHSGIREFRENTIETYEIQDPNYDFLFKNIWSDYVISDASANSTSKTIITYEDLRQEFESVVLGNLATSTLPKRDRYNNIIEVFSDTLNESDGTGLKSIKNAVMKSFIFDNTILSFKVPGMLFREPGNFIGINNLYSVESSDPLEGLWYVIDVKHVFEGSLYTNQITAVKFFNIVGPQVTMRTNQRPSIGDIGPAMLA
jgi:hypothetical protein